MKFYKFRDEGSARLALTADPLGRDLPRDGSVWQALGATDVSECRTGLSAIEVGAEIAKNGVVFWSDPET